MVDTCIHVCMHVGRGRQEEIRGILIGLPASCLLCCLAYLLPSIIFFLATLLTCLFPSFLTNLLHSFLTLIAINAYTYIYNSLESWKKKDLLTKKKTPKKRNDKRQRGKETEY